MPMIGEQILTVNYGSLCEQGVVSLYFHIPFCRKKCDYCHFYVLPSTHALADEFARTILDELRLKKQQLEDKKVVSLYFGGGTPTVFGSEWLCSLVGSILDELALSSVKELTVEANPEDLDHSFVKALISSGVNRLSVGVQSLDDGLLQLLSRTHNSRRSIDALECCFAAGMENVSADLMYELPSQTNEGWLSTVLHLIELPITHLSIYNLVFEPHTSFFKRRKQLEPLLPSDENGAKMSLEACALLEERGWERYEISAFARNGCYSLHNSGYWVGRPYLGLGPSAHSFFEGKRYANASHLLRWSQAVKAKDMASAVEYDRELNSDERRSEMLAIHLRCLWGVEIASFEMRWGKLTENQRQSIKELLEEGLLEYEKGILRLTERGRLFYDAVAEQIILL